MDTITAIATPLGQSAIGIIKISGPGAIKIVQKIYQGKKRDKNLTDVASHTIHYGHIIYPRTKKKIDEVLISVMRKPHSYTREDVVEINCHGGKFCLYKILELVLMYGARLAEPGEFTKRAFLNGRIDLTQAEAVIDLINAQSEQGISLLMDTLEGNTFIPLYALHREIQEWRALIEADLNFSGTISSELSRKKLLEDINQWSRIINSYINSQKAGAILVNGLRMAIVGKTNVGKSSLMNLLLRKDRSIVTNIPGTTTDIIEDNFLVDGVIIHLIDTAGFCRSKNKIEEEGLRRTRNIIDKADALVVVLDGSEAIEKEDNQILDLVSHQHKPFFIILNKIDLDIKLSKNVLSSLLKQEVPLLNVSALSGEGISSIPRTISSLCLPDYKNGLSLHVNLRQKDILLQMKNSLQALKDLLDNEHAEDLLAEEIRYLDTLLSRFRGQEISENVLDRIFATFCVGK